MLGGLVVAFVLTALASAVYAVILASLKWAHDIGRSIHKVKKAKGGRHYLGRCATCGVNFIENPEVVDGKCIECDRPLCHGCSAQGWVCPFCNKKRDKEESPKLLHGRRRSFTLLMQSILKHKEHHGSSESLLKRTAEEPHSTTNGISFHANHSPTPKRAVVKPSNSEFGTNSSNGWCSDYESDTELVTGRETWEDNWLFKKKLPIDHMQPLAMFVPNPKKESRAKIGGVEVDELSDFSDYSDSEIDEIIK